MTSADVVDISKESRTAVVRGAEAQEITKRLGVHGPSRLAKCEQSLYLRRKRDATLPRRPVERLDPEWIAHQQYRFVFAVE